LLAGRSQLRDPSHIRNSRSRVIRAPGRSVGSEPNLARNADYQRFAEGVTASVCTHARDSVAHGFSQAARTEGDDQNSPRKESDRLNRSGFQRGEAPTDRSSFEIDEQELTKPSIYDRDIVVHVKSQIRSASQHNAPMLPELAQRSLTVAGDPDVSIRALVEIIEPDPVTTARVLAISNGPLYAPGKRIASLKSAIMLLGVGLVRDVLYQSVAEAHIFRGASAKMLARQRLHGVAVGYLMRSLSGHLGMNRDYAFLAGLLHDVGTIVLQQMLDTCPPVTYEPSHYDLVMESLHGEVGHHVAQRWELPPAVAEVANRHHDFEGDGRDGYSQLGHVAAAAERLAEHVGLSEDGSQRPLEPQDMSMFYRLGLDEMAIDAALHEAERVEEHVRALG